MPIVSKNQAIDLLTKEVEENLHADDLLEVCNELFPEEPYPVGVAHEDTRPLIEKLVDYLHSGLETEEIVDRWQLIFPKHRKVWYDEEEQRIHFTEEVEPLHAD